MNGIIAFLAFVISVAILLFVPTLAGQLFVSVWISNSVLLWMPLCWAWLLCRDIVGVIIRRERVPRRLPLKVISAGAPDASRDRDRDICLKRAGLFRW